VQVLVSLKVWVSAPSVPQESPVVGVQLSLSAGSVVVQLVSATVLPSERKQVTLLVAVPELAVPTHVPVRV
jgi:hypothetical protein